MLLLNGDIVIKYCIDCVDTLASFQSNQSSCFRPYMYKKEVTVMAHALSDMHGANVAVVNNCS